VIVYITLEMMLRVCLHQIMNIHERQLATEGSIMLRQVHQQIFQEMVSHQSSLILLAISIHRHLMCYLRLGMICGIDIFHIIFI